MHPLLQIQPTGKGAAVLSLIVLAVLAVLALVWLVYGAMPAIAGGIGVVLLVRKVLALFNPTDRPRLEAGVPTGVIPRASSERRRSAQSGSEDVPCQD